MRLANIFIPIRKSLRFLFSVHTVTRRVTLFRRRCLFAQSGETERHTVGKRLNFCARICCLDDCSFASCAFRRAVGQRATISKSSLFSSPPVRGQRARATSPANVWHHSQIERNARNTLVFVSSDWRRLIKFPSLPCKFAIKIAFATRIAQFATAYLWASALKKHRTSTIDTIGKYKTTRGTRWSLFRVTGVI